MEKHSRHLSPEDELIKGHIKEVQANLKEPKVVIGTDLPELQKSADEKASELAKFQNQSRVKKWRGKEIGKTLEKESNSLGEKLETSLDKAIEQLSKYADDFEIGYWGCVRLFTEALKDEKIKALIPEMGEYSLLDHSDPHGIAFGLGMSKERLQGELDKEFVKQVLLWNNQRFETAKERLAQNIEQMKSRLLNRVKIAHDAGDFPLSAEEVSNRIKDVTFRVGDGVKMGPTYAAYQNRHRSVTINHFSDLEEAEDSVAHEIMHAAAGQTILHRPKADKELHEDEFEYQRSGLGFMRYNTISLGDGKKQKYPTGNNFKWLDEAVTEDLALILRTPVVPSYEKAMTYLDHLVAKGIPKELFYKAYFEHYDPNSGDTIPAWKELSSAINEALRDEGGLMALNKYSKIFEEQKKPGEPEL